MNEISFVAWLGAQTALWRQAHIDTGSTPLIAVGTIEDKQRDPATGRVKRCDMRLMDVTGRRLASGEFKRPEVSEGRDPRSEALRLDAHRKAVWGGVSFYFTCNMARIVLYRTADRPGEGDREVREFDLAPITSSSGYPAYEADIAARWFGFLDFLEDQLKDLDEARPAVSPKDVLSIRNAIEAVVLEAAPRAMRSASSDPARLEDLRAESVQKFGFHPALDPSYRDTFEREMRQILRFGVFVASQKMILYRVLQESGPRRASPFHLDEIQVPDTSTDPEAVERVLEHAWGHAIDRTGDFESAFLPQPFSDHVFLPPGTPEEISVCSVGAVWAHLQATVAGASWGAISRNLVGFLYEMIIDPAYRHELGQYYTREDVVDLLTAFAIHHPADVVLDPAAGGGSFLWSAYRRKRELGDTHEQALEAIWGFELTAFAAELSTITLATADAEASAAYPRVALTDFFDVRPGEGISGFELPDSVEAAQVPEWFDAVVGNPPYISYRRITNQDSIVNALAESRSEMSYPRFSGKSDQYAWFIVHATQFLRDGGRLAFVVSSAILFSDYGIPLIRFLGHHFRIVAVVDSMVERWFPEADTNTVLLLLERETDSSARAANHVRFVRLRRPLSRLLPPLADPSRRDGVEDVVEAIVTADPAVEDPRLSVRLAVQGEDGALELVETDGTGMLEESEADDS